MSHGPAKSFQLPETLEPMVLMSASAADLTAEELSAGTAGNDLIISLTPDELIDGGAGHDIMIALGGNNVLRGGAGHDTLISVRGDNVLDGGAGIDKAVYWNGNRADFTVTDHGFGIYEIAGSKNSDFITNIEQVQFQDGVYSIQELLSGVSNAPALGSQSQDSAEQTVDSLKTPTAGNDVLVANLPGETIDALAGDDIVVGLGNGNTILGSEGNDAILPAGGSNFIDGGAGRDTVVYGGNRADYTLASAPGGAISVSSSSGQDILINVETLSFQDGAREVSSLNLPPVVEVPVVEEPVVEVPVVEVPVVEVPVVEVPVVEVPVVEVPVVEEPVVEEPVVEEPVVEEPVVEEPVVEEPVVEEPVFEEPVVEEPVGMSFTLPMAGNLYATVSTDAAFSYELLQAPAIGSINFYPDGSFDFHAPVGFVGTATFQYRIISPDGSSTDVATLVIESSVPVEEPVVEVPVVEEPVEEVPVVEEPVEEVPVEEVPVEEVPVEEVSLLLDPADAINQVDTDGISPVTIKFQSDSGLYRSTVGSYLINNETGAVSDVKILFANASAAGSGGDLTPGVAEATVAGKPNHSIGFFIVPDAASWNDTASLVSASLSLEQSAGNGLKLVAVKSNGESMTVDGDVYISTHPRMNRDGKDHFRFSQDADGLRIGIEDMYNLGDKDFDDVVITVETGKAPLTGGDGNDHLSGSADNDTIFANGGNDYVDAGAGDDFILAGTGDDVVRGRDGNDYIDAGAGDDNIMGENGNDILRGREGHDFIAGGEGDDNILGEDGNDALFGDLGNDFIGGGSGDDIISDALPGYEDGGDDLFFGDDGNDRIHGGSGNDYLVGGAGADVIEGGLGDDLITFDNPFVDNEDPTTDGAGDYVSGGAEGDMDNDTLDLRGAGLVKILQYADPTDSGATRGTVTFQNGSTLTFEGIETILSDSSEIIDGGAEPEVNLVVNGSFEANLIAGKMWTPIDANHVEGWKSLNGQAIEFWANGFDGVQPTDGNNMIEMDYNSGSTLDGIYQDIQTEAGKTYVLTFDMRARGDNPVSDDEALAVEWNGVKLTQRYTADQPGEWVTLTAVVTGTGNLDRLLFRESFTHGASDSTGPFLDNIRLVEEEVEVINLD